MLRWSETWMTKLPTYGFVFSKRLLKSPVTCARQAHTVFKQKSFKHGLVLQKRAAIVTAMHHDGCLAHGLTSHWVLAQLYQKLWRPIASQKYEKLYKWVYYYFSLPCWLNSDNILDAVFCCNISIIEDCFSQEFVFCKALLFCQYFH